MKIDANTLRLVGAGILIAIGVADHFIVDPHTWSTVDFGLVSAGVGALGLGQLPAAVVSLTQKKS